MPMTGSSFIAETGAMVNNSKNPEAHYTYISLDQVYWDYLHCYWRPKGTVGDRYVKPQWTLPEMPVECRMLCFTAS